MCLRWPSVQGKTRRTGTLFTKSTLSEHLPQVKFRFFLLLPFFLFPLKAVEVALSGEGKELAEAHGYLFGEFGKSHWPVFPEKGGGRSISGVTLKLDPIDTEGDFEIALPSGTGRVLGFFRYIELRGTGLDGIGKLQLMPVAPGSGLDVSTHTGTTYRVKVPALSVVGDEGGGLFLKGSGKARIESIGLVAYEGGIAEIFDTLPFRNLGDEQPAVRVELDVSADETLSISGHRTLDREKFFRYYGRPGSLPDAMERWALERNFTPGRQMLKLSPAFEEGHGNPKEIILTEDPGRPGKIAPGILEKLKPDLYKDLGKLYPDDFEFAMCLNEWPSFMSRQPSGRGTPRIESFDDAAQLAADYIVKEKQHSGRTAKWWEVKNESTIVAEWDYHFKKDESGKPFDSWGLLADFHNRVADAVHGVSPETKVGGPTSAWMQLQVNDFGLWRDQARFMDLTRDRLDFYSHHFYENSQSVGAERRLGGGYENYLLGRLETLLDMIRSHGIATWNVKPILVTEYGALNIGNTEADHWLRLRSYSAYLTRFMQRPDQVDLAVPFIFLASPWDPTNGHAVFIPKGKGYPNDLSTYDITPCAHFFDLWRDFKGDYVPVTTSHRYLETVAVRDGNVIRIALSNMSCSRLDVDLGSAFGEGKASECSQRRLYWKDGKVCYEDAAKADPRHIVVDAEETTIVSLTLPGGEAPAAVSETRDYFAPAIVLKVAGEAAFPIVLPDDRKGLRSASLHIGLHRRGSLAEDLEISVNGHKIPFDTRWGTGHAELFTTIEVPVPPEILSRENSVELRTAAEGLTISSAHMELVGSPSE
jgi:hypothetical protein